MDMTLPGLHAAYRGGALTPADVVDVVLERSARYAHHNIWIAQPDREAIQVYLDRLAGHSPDTLPLYGIPFAIKDNIDLAGVPTTAACPDFAYTPAHSAFVVERLIEAGAIPIGKTNMDQFATGLVGTRSPAPWGACANAFDARYIAGGSSSGSAVAVALGLVSFALGTDTAGSGRVPAAFNNLVGLKPTRGLISTRGVLPACRTLDCVSIFALDTDDADAVLACAAVYDPDDDYARPNRYANNHRHYGLPRGGFTLGVPRAEQLDFFGNDKAARLFDQAIERLEALGGTRRVIDFTPFLNAARLLYEGPWVAERYAAIKDFIQTNPKSLLAVTREIIGAAAGRTAVESFEAEYQMQHYRRQARGVLDDVDFLVTPTAGTIYTIEEVDADPVRLNSNLGYYTNYLNLLDCAAVNVPAGFLDNGVAFGISLVGPAFSDRRLLSHAHRWQQALRLPPGALSRPLAAGRTAAPADAARTLSVVVCGAHLQGLALNWQLTERGARLLAQTQTSPSYRMYALPGGPPHRPGLIRDESNGAGIEVEVWSIPAEEFGGFVAAIPAPLAIGKVELADGRWLPGFVCEAYGVVDADDITHLRGWRAYLAQINGVRPH